MSKQTEVASARSIARMPPVLLASLRQRGLFRCHSVVPECARPPAGEFCRPDGLRSLFCREHLAAYCRRFAVAEPDVTPAGPADHHYPN